MYMKIHMPAFAMAALDQLHAAGFDAYLVGGCVRDTLIGREPHDFDITTNATPEQIQTVFGDTLYNNNFGTVVVRMYDDHDMRHEIEVTPYRVESIYSDQRHPDAVVFGVSLEEDLRRRDFTVNALATDGKTIIDLFGGRADCRKKIIRTVGEPRDRFSEDALRLLRAPRFAAQLGFSLDPETLNAITRQTSDIRRVSSERVRDELLKTVLSDDAFRGFWIMHTSGLMREILPELEEGVGVSQNKHHIYTIFMHNMMSMQYCPSDDPLVRFAALLHDVGKPRTKEGNGADASFHQHEHVGGQMTWDIMRRLKFSRSDSERVAHLVRNHMFYYAQDEVSDAGIRRLLKRIGREHLDDLMAIRIGDRMGSGCQKEKPFKLVELERRIRMVEKDPMDVTMLAVNGNEVMHMTGLKPGREVGVILNTLLEEVLEDPSLNNRVYLEQRVMQFTQMELNVSTNERYRRK